MASNLYSYVSDQDTLSNVKMNDSLFYKFSNYIHREFGIKLPISKKVMLQSRLQKRLRKLSMKSFKDYYDFVFQTKEGNDELVEMINVVTTNKTDFFREPKHFEYLTSNALPELLNSRLFSIRKKIAIWSAGCSTGEEPYTLSIVLNEFCEQKFLFSFEILATDISTGVLKMAHNAVYPLNKVEPIPLPLKKKYLLKSKDPGKKMVKINSVARKPVTFSRLNLMDRAFDFKEPFDVIFCRNVIIYFDRPTQEKLLMNYYTHLAPGGYLFLGHSETLNGMDTPFKQVAPTIYRKF
ncbi:MAG: CheR family methyltransferase [Vulcanimicrobiota bacterium]